MSDFVMKTRASESSAAEITKKVKEASSVTLKLASLEAEVKALKAGMKKRWETGRGSGPRGSGEVGIRVPGLSLPVSSWNKNGLAGGRVIHWWIRLRKRLFLCLVFCPIFLCGLDLSAQACSSEHAVVRSCNSRLVLCLHRLLLVTSMPCFHRRTTCSIFDFILEDVCIFQPGSV